MKSSVMRCIVLVWLACSFLALGAMWWRWARMDATAYLGQCDRIQRERVMARYGMDPALITAAQRVETTWAPDVHYTARGNPQALSYILYLLAPRVPDGNPDSVLSLGESVSSEDPGSVVNPEAQSASRITLHPPYTPGERHTNRTYGWLGLLLSIAATAGLGALVRRILRIRDITWPECIALGTLIGSVLTVIGKAFITGSRASMWIWLCGGIAGLLLDRILRARARRANAEPGKTIVSATPLPHHWLPVSVLILIVGFLAWSVATTVIGVPDDWDCFAIWGPKAKILLAQHTTLQDVTHFGHADYPLLWPSLWAFSAFCSGGWEEHAVRAWGPLFLALVLLQAGLFLRKQRRSSTAVLLTAGVLVSIPMAPVLASWSYAEVFLWLMITCSYVRLVYARQSADIRHAILAGIFAAGAAHTKNEGVLFALLAACWILVFATRRRGRLLCAYMTPLILLYAPWWLWIRHVAPNPNHALAGLELSVDTLSRASSRLLPALAAIGAMLADLRAWSCVLLPVLITAVYQLLRGSPETRRFLSLPATYLAVLFVIVVFHRNDVGWLVGCAWDRLMLQMWPVLLVALAGNTGMDDALQQAGFLQPT